MRAAKIFVTDLKEHNVLDKVCNSLSYKHKKNVNKGRNKSDSTHTLFPSLFFLSSLHLLLVHYPTVGPI